MTEMDFAWQRLPFSLRVTHSSAALSGSVRRPCIPTTFAAAPPAWSRLLTETSFLLLHQELSVVCSCCSSTERHAVMLAHLFSWLARTFGRQMFWQWRNQMTCFHRGTNSLFDIRKKEKKNKKQCRPQSQCVAEAVTQGTAYAGWVQRWLYGDRNPS